MKIVKFQSILSGLERKWIVQPVPGTAKRFPRKRAPSCGQWDELAGEKVRESKCRRTVVLGAAVPGSGRSPGDARITGELGRPRGRHLPGLPWVLLRSQGGEPPVRSPATGTSGLPAAPGPAAPLRPLLLPPLLHPHRQGPEARGRRRLRHGALPLPRPPAAAARRDAWCLCPPAEADAQGHAPGGTLPPRALPAWPPLPAAAVVVTAPRGGRGGPGGMRAQGLARGLPPAAPQAGHATAQ